MTESNQIRLDKFLWSVRIYKTRNLATEACKKGRIIIDNQQVKPSRMIKAGVLIHVKKSPVTYSYLVKDLPKSRLSPKLVVNYIEDKSSPEELVKLKNMDTFFSRRDKGSGRPTKKERRDYEKILNQ